MARSMFAALVVLVLLAVGAYFILALEPGRGPDAFLGLLLLREGFSACAIAAWASVAAGFFAFLMAYGLFRDPVEQRGRGIGQRPYGLPFFFILVSLALFWAALACAGASDEDDAGRNVPVVAEPEPELDLLGGPEPVVEPAPEPEPEPVTPPPPEVAVYEAPLAWRYADPLVLNGDWRQSAAMRGELSALFPLSDPGGRVRALLCGKAWVALAGAASQEGPRARNERRARLRAELAAAEARRWLDRQDSGCGRPVVLGVDLGQHVELGPARGDGADTARQRQILIVHRAAAYAGERPTPLAAQAELRAFLADPAQRRRLLDGRVYAGEPDVFIAEGQ